jgi:hypothetical protein
VPGLIRTDAHTSGVDLEAGKGRRKGKTGENGGNGVRRSGQVDRRYGRSARTKVLVRNLKVLLCEGGERAATRRRAGEPPRTQSTLSMALRNMVRRSRTALRLLRMLLRTAERGGR